ncbi:MAG: tRNA (N(6)-L-threonylcarbamoyladenosine(37)-C(2))-methylthiotransferase MtaB [Cellvibrionales bacterium TMED49]|uniref:tRNA (N(6)-L-threonylcarbamoyladenosine(37)-C(2))-methylthiotransferase n=1 Tax=PS1 clade bacterium TaxID=2175152 RepID=A0A368DSY6_9PROT|nr:tRNA (N(6)-L-threonylcarbamoyladenosine(37)-C(2))-methylthiotransferase MtaB [Rhodobiaceae bacterium]MAU86830.1 tRNA (N(6)-L-threonylcarbamoyladenosine(37)-C(2))-methylthiotransferase MtaB [Rhodobiaceae bacterium]OUT75040.1 MAG: tRNA (N(6)-L-threonylcarbamoyladenosine(37)-C(2))-methylthiotransferase MtaB [Rhizobiales bacterium TMED25]OUU40452.1 MAG: tRNA (N(6)-L-threonylcarbamoyladenosine(37)-C(2))-methylthiotransferase MtaB [Cellvibrionales bacterium TMED49]RCL74393.1 MAG: tRNA (N(6)-L-thre|tara:strand:- start:3026 stop:4270 length:1245 start_codon:yes stop_codon:yes gene_type:complete
MKNNLNFITFGCKLNAFETQVMKEKAEHYNLSNFSFINSCAVTNQAVKQTRQAIRKERRENPDNKIIVTGCAAELHPNEFMSMPEVDCIIGNHEKTKLSTFGNLVGIKKDISEENIIEEETPFIKNFDNRTRAFVQIQNGCDHRCTFCIIPYARGQSRSIDQETIIRQIQTLLDKGYHEIILTGVDITSYGQDLNEKINLGILIKNIIKGTNNLKRLRISSIDSIEIDDDFLEVFTSEKIIMPHLHLSLQSGNDMILKRMLRRHQTKDAIAFCEKIQKVRPESVFGADLIAGFPTESDSMHKSTKKHITDCNLTYLHIFPFSAKQGTPAARMPQVEKKVIQKRSKELREVGGQRLNIFLINEVGKEKKVLVEKPGFGRTEQYSKVLIPEDNNQGTLITKKIIGINKDQLMAQLN